MKPVQFLLLSILCIICASVNAQNKIVIDANFNAQTNEIDIKQSITLINTSSKALDTIFFNDWNNSYSSRETDLAKRFAEEYSTKLHFAKEKDKGFTTIQAITINKNSHDYTRSKPDIIAVALKNTVQPKDSISINLKYTLKLPSDKFTRFGITDKKNVKLREWFITPAKLTDKWVYYSNKDLNDLYFPNSTINLTINTPNTHKVISDFDIITTKTTDSITTTQLLGRDRINSETHLVIHHNFEELATDKFTYVTNIDDEGIGLGLKAVIHDKIAFFLSNKLGEYPHQKILLSDAAYRRNPVYGLNQLPDFIRPFPDGFQYEIKILKATIGKYIKNTINTNPRTNYWLNDAIESYLMYQYVAENYPNMKILGSLAKIWGVRSFEIAKKKFNDQYYYFNLYTARKNLDQKLSSPKDSLLKYNVNISNKNKAGVGLLYLNDFLGGKVIDSTLKQFYTKNALKDIEGKHFITALQSNTNKDISWFLPDYVNTNKRIDYTIKNVTPKGTVLRVHLKNKEQTSTPISIYQIIDNKIISKHYFDGFIGEKIVDIPNNKPDRVILNYEEIIPEYNLRNNTKTIKPHLFNKPLKFTLIKDAEAPKYNQFFYVPDLGYNLYDGFSPGLIITNKTLLNRAFTYKVKPMYGLSSKKLVGSISTNYIKHYKNKKLFSSSFGLSYQKYHYQDNLSYQRFNPYIALSFRDKNDLRDNKRSFIVARNVTVEKQRNEFVIDDTPNYNVFNLKFGISDANLINYNAFSTDLQFSNKFGKISANYEYRKLFANNRQLNWRIFAGGFLYNNTNSDFFSFALDRPSDYLFDYNYYGRSESTGIYSQQIIIAEGGFKSKLNTPYANEWIATTNLSTNIWKYIFAYGDAGFVGNNKKTHFVYDSGIHLNLVPDYFELYFPVYSNLGWEISQPHYSQKIRFKITLSPKVLIGLFTRKWL